MQSVLAIENCYFPLWQDLRLIDIYLASQGNQPLLQELKQWFDGDRSLTQ